MSAASEGLVVAVSFSRVRCSGRLCRENDTRTETGS